MQIYQRPLTPFALALWALWFLGAGISFFWIEKGDVVLALNARHTPPLNGLFHAWTYLGDGWMFLVVLLAAALVRRYHAVALLTAVVVQTVLVHLGKRVLFPRSPRPLEWFGRDAGLSLVPDVQVHLFHSFPSGHTATAFTLAFLVMLWHRQVWSTVLVFLLAIGVGVSRMWLVQHFWQDVYVGSLVSFVTGLVVWALYYRRLPTWSERPFWQK